jgi:hypothetical protein
MEKYSDSHPGEKIKFGGRGKRATGAQEVCEKPLSPVSPMVGALARIDSIEETQTDSRPQRIIPES